MPPPPQVVQALNRQFQKPRVDPEWLEGCCQWVIDERKLSPLTDFPEFMEEVKDQLLRSDLSDSMLHGTGLDVHIAGYTGTLRGPPILVQIIKITEIGTSAFQLEQIRVAREERMQAGVGNEEGEEDGDVEVEGEGPMPKYPRGTLRFQLSDGATTLQAMEYRPLPQLTLGVTPLGFKMQLKGTRLQNGMAFLEPATVNLVGGRQEDLEAQQFDDFKTGLYARLGRDPPIVAQVQAALNPQIMDNTAQAAVRSPLHDISPPPLSAFPLHDDDVNMEPRRRIPTNSSVNNPLTASSNDDAKRTRPIAPLPSRYSIGSREGNSEELAVERKVPSAERATLVHAGSKQQSTTSLYFNDNAAASGSRSSAQRGLDNTINTAVEDLDFNFVPTPRQLSRTFSSPSPFPSPEPPKPNEGKGKKNSSFDFDLLDDVDHDENQPPPRAASNKGKGRAEPLGTHTHRSADNDDSSSDDYGMMDDENVFADADFLENLNQVEMAALQGDPTKAGIVHPPSSTSGSGGSGTVSSSYVMVDDATRSSTFSSTRAPSSPMRVADVIEIDDSDEEMGADDKENAPVAARHVRQRTEDDAKRSAGLASQPWGQSQGLSQRTGRPVVLAINPDDVIDLSDSD